MANLFSTFCRSMPTSAALDVVAKNLKLKFFEVSSLETTFSSLKVPKSFDLSINSF